MFTLNAEIRKEKGKIANKRLLFCHKFPAIIYGGQEQPIAIELFEYSLGKLNSKLEFSRDIFLILKIKEKEIKVKIQEIQYHSFKKKILHIDFIRI